MAPTRFNPPPGWPVPTDWSPAQDWQPDPAWPPAPPGWQFWTDEPVPTDLLPGPASEKGRRSSTRRPLLLTGSAVALVAAMSAAIVVVVTKWTGSSGAPALPDRMLADTYPSQPEFAWRVRAQDLGIGADSVIRTPEYSSLGAETGAIVAGDHVVVMPWSRSDTSANGRLVSLSLTDGHIEWSTLIDSETLSCAPRAFGGSLLCLADGSGGTNTTEVRAIDLGSGDVTSRAPVPFRASLIDNDADSVYVAGIDLSADTFIVAKGSADRPASGWRTAITNGECVDYPTDSWDFTIKHGVVSANLGGGASAVLNTADGSSLLDHAVVDAWAADGPVIVSRRCQSAVDEDQWKSEVADGQGRPLFTTPSQLRQFSMDVYAGEPVPLIARNGDALDRMTGDKRWQINASVNSPLVVGHMVMLSDGRDLAGYEMGTGKELWRSDSAGGVRTDGALTDGERVIFPSEGGGMIALGVVDGSIAWRFVDEKAADSNAYPVLYATPAGILLVDSGGIGLLSPTGPPATVPDSTADGDGDAAPGGTNLVAKCGRPPEFRPQAIRAESGELVITMKIVARCPGGDVLGSRQTRITVMTGDQNVASAMFDLSAKPIVISPDSGGSSGDPEVTHEFHFPVGTFWRLPVSLDEAPGNGAMQRGRIDIDAETLVVECEQDGASEISAGADVNSKSSTATGPGQPKTGDNESASFDALRAIADADRPFVSTKLADRWVPQLSSKRPGLVADGITWNNAETLREHLELRMKYPEVRLLWSGDWATFSAPDFWITIAGVTFPDSGGALGWCRDHGLDPEHCYAKLVSVTHPIEGSTAFNK